MNPTYMKKSWAGDLLIGSDLALGPSFKSNNGSLGVPSFLSGGYNLHQFSNTLGLICHRVFGCKTNLWEIMGCDSSDLVRCDFGPLLQSQMRIAKLKSVYNSLFIGPRGLGCDTNQ